MKLAAKSITPCLWFDSQAEQAAQFYVSVFENSAMGSISRYSSEGQDIHGKKAGTVMTAQFEVAGIKFLALNGGPQFNFTEAISFQIHCDTQEEIDYFWSTLSEGGSEGPCGWLKDKFGLSWQVVPTALPEMLKNSESTRAQRVTKAFLGMKKFDLKELRRAYEG